VDFESGTIARSNFALASAPGRSSIKAAAMFAPLEQPNAIGRPMPWRRRADERTSLKICGQLFACP
jgi:hypothetical protein